MSEPVNGTAVAAHAHSGRLRATRRAPAARRHALLHRAHGQTWHDDFGWLRDPAYPDVRDAEVVEYLTAENAYFTEVMSPHQQLVDTLYDEIKGRIKEDDASYPYRRRDYWYQWRFAQGAQYATWWRWRDGSEQQELLIDEPKLAEGANYFRLGAWDLTDDHRYLAWAVDNDGSERYVIRFKDYQRGAMLEDELPNCGGNLLWCGHGDAPALLYTPLTENFRPYQVRLHRLGTPHAQDVVLYEEADEGFFVGIQLTQSEDYVVVTSGDHVTSELRVVPASDPLQPLQLIAERRANHEYDLDHAGGWFYVRSNDTHKNFRLVRAPVATPQQPFWDELIAGSDSTYLLDFTAFDNALAIRQRVDGLDQVCLHFADGRRQAVQFPEAVYSAWFGTNAEPHLEQLRLGYSSLVTPSTVYDYDLQSSALITRKVQQLPSGYDASRYACERRWVVARDGARVPVSLVSRKDLQLPGALYLYAYGAYGLGESPHFSGARLSLLDRGFTYAIAHVRGGDELGYHWYEGGKLAQRHNSFADFIDVARQLIADGVTEAGRIAISGGSAGGTLVGVVLNEAPELWGAAAAHVPFVDVLNTMMDASLPLTPIEWPEWGNPVQDAAAWQLIRGYSPYDNVQPQQYPPLLVTAGLHDPRVTYWEPAKWVARLRQLKTDRQLLLLKTHMEAGHGGRSGRFESIRETAEEFAFMLCAMERG